MSAAAILRWRLRGRRGAALRGHCGLRCDGALCHACSACSAGAGSAESRAMSLRSLKVLEDDVRAARERFVLTKRLARLVLKDETIVFEVAGKEGDFTAFVSDPYPMEATVVYGPDDFECHTSGTVDDTILAVLSQLQTPEANRIQLDFGSEGSEEIAVPSQLKAKAGHIQHDSHDSGSDCEEMDWIVTDRPPEPALAADLNSVQQLLGESAVLITQLCPNTYRLRLYVPVKCAVLDARVCTAWGLKPDVPLCVDICLPVSGYGFGTVEPSMLKQIRQEGFNEFALEKQLMQILANFCLVCKNRAWERFERDEHAEHAEPSATEHPEPENMCRHFELKKQSLMLQALAHKELGFLYCLGAYLQLRMPTLHEYCAICDSAFSLPPMMMRSVCPRELCTYQFGEFGSKITSAEGMNNHAEVIDLLVCMLVAAATSSRRHLIFDPFPKVYVGEQLRVVLHPESKDFSKLETYVKELQSLRVRVGNQLGASWSAKTSSMSAEAAALLKWTVASNRSFLAPLQEWSSVSLNFECCPLKR